MARFARAGLLRRYAPRNDAEALREHAFSIVKQPPASLFRLRALRFGATARATPGTRVFFVARMSAAICGSSLAESHPGCRCRSSGLRIRTCVIAPCLVRPRARRSFLSRFSPRGVRNDRAFHRARGARMLLMRASRMPLSAHGQWSSPTPKIVELNRASDADLRLRSARAWIFRLAASLTGNCRLRRPRPDRTNCRTGMHLDRPPVASASISCPTADPRLSPVILPSVPTMSVTVVSSQHSGPTSQRPPHPAAT